MKMGVSSRRNSKISSIIRGNTQILALDGFGFKFNSKLVGVRVN